MKYKVSIFNRKVINQYLSIISVIGLIFSFILIFYNIPEERKQMLGILFLGLLILIYLGVWISANKMREVTISANNSVLEVKVGDIFKEEGLKVIAFNEYFDTQVDNKIIAENSLNGIFINRFVDEPEKIQELDNNIANSTRLRKKIVENNIERMAGKKIKYKLGSIYEHNEYLLTAFSKFDKDDRAYLDMKAYVDFLLEFWNEIDVVYNGRTVVIPLLGSGITRFKDYNLGEQELLELLIWSFKVSRVKFTYPSKVVIVVHSSTEDKINFYSLK